MNINWIKRISVVGAGTMGQSIPLPLSEVNFVLEPIGTVCCP